MEATMIRQLFCLVAFAITLVPTLTAASFAGQPEDLPLLQRSDLVYNGAFRVPKGRYGNSRRESSLSFGGWALAFRPAGPGKRANGSLYLAGPDKMITEIAIPPLVDPSDATACPSRTPSCLKTAAVIQGSFDISNGNWTKIGKGRSEVEEGTPAGLLVYGDRLIGTVQTQYDERNVYSHYTAALEWNYADPSSASFKGMYRVGVNPVRASSSNAGFVGGYLGRVPASFREALGGPVMTGALVDSVISRSSYGPTAWIFDPDTLAASDPADAEMVLGYPSSHAELFDYGRVADQPTANGSMQVRGITFPEGTRSVIFWGGMGIGMSGKGSMCYGEGTEDLTQVKRKEEVAAWSAAHGGATYRCGGNLIRVSNGIAENPCCFDRVRTESKGEHAYPYVYRAWVYDANDLAAVKAGKKKPWHLRPYAVWDFSSYRIEPGAYYRLSPSAIDLPFGIEDAAILGAAYDPATQRIFLAQKGGDKPNIEPFPIIHVFSVRPMTR